MDPFLGQIIIFAGNFAPRGWAFCDGQLLSIAQNSALFSILGTTYGGDGVTTFALPDLRGRVPLSPGTGPGLSKYTQGQRGGAENVSLNVNQIPAHNHQVGASTSTKNTVEPAAGNILASPDGTANFANSDPDTTMRESSIRNTGGGQEHENRQPFLAIPWIIALQGVFPSRS